MRAKIRARKKLHEKRSAMAARISAFSEVDSKLRVLLSEKLRACDDALVLPQGHVSVESGSAKCVVVRLDGTSPSPPFTLMSSEWGAGVSVLQVDTNKAVSLLGGSEERRSALRRLADAIPSELADVDLEIGPRLDASTDGSGRDLEGWQAGFDTASCCVGLYAAQQSRGPESCGKQGLGMRRTYCDYYLVAKAGSGRAGKTFHSRLGAAFKTGASLEDALSENGNPGAALLQRTIVAGQRNRRRLLALAADALGFNSIDTVSDQVSAHQDERMAIPSAESICNTLRREESGSGSSSKWLYFSGCHDQTLSTGLISVSNASEGFLMFAAPDGSVRLRLHNSVHDTLPFSSPRILTNRDAVSKAAACHKQIQRQEERGPATSAHPDGEWLSKRFAWKAKHFSDDADKIEPPCLWGSYDSEQFLAEWARELGVSAYVGVRLTPELVALSGPEAGKLRVAAKALARS